MLPAAHRRERSSVNTAHRARPLLTANASPHRQGLAKLRAVFKADGSTTAGNSSQVSDGAAAVLLASREKAEELGLPVLATLKSFAVRSRGPWG